MKASSLAVLETCGLLLEMEGSAPKHRTHERCGSALPSLREEIVVWHYMSRPIGRDGWRNGLLHCQDQLINIKWLAHDLDILVF